MIGDERIKQISERFEIPVKDIKEFLQPPQNEEEARHAQFRFMFLAENYRPFKGYAEFCLLHKTGRFVRLLDELRSSVDIREAAYHIVTHELETEELEIFWDGNVSNKQYYLVRDYCPPLYAGPDLS